MPPKRVITDGPPEQFTALNDDYLSSFYDAVSTVLAHPVFKGFRSKKPLGIGSGGHSAEYNSEHFRLSMSNVGTYEAACNLGWLNEKFSTINGVPYNRKLVERYAREQFAIPTNFPFPIVVACTIGRNTIRCRIAAASGLVPQRRSSTPSTSRWQGT